MFLRYLNNIWIDEYIYIYNSNFGVLKYIDTVKINKGALLLYIYNITNVDQYCSSVRVP